MLSCIRAGRVMLVPFPSPSQLAWISNLPVMGFSAVQAKSPLCCPKMNYLLLGHWETTMTGNLDGDILIQLFLMLNEQCCNALKILSSGDVVSCFPCSVKLFLEVFTNRFYMPVSPDRSCLLVLIDIFLYI